MKLAACMRCKAAAAAMAWLRSPPTSSHAATHKAGAEFGDTANVMRCMGSKTERGALRGMTCLRCASMSAVIEAQYEDWFWDMAIFIGL